MLVPDRRWYEYPFPTAFIGGVTAALGGFFYGLANGSPDPVANALAAGLGVFTLSFTGCSFVRHIEAAAKQAIHVDSQFLRNVADAEPEVQVYQPPKAAPMVNLGHYDAAMKVWPSMFKDWPVTNRDAIPRILDTLLEPGARATHARLKGLVARNEMQKFQDFIVQRRFGEWEGSTVYITPEGREALQKLRNLV